MVPLAVESPRTERVVDPAVTTGQGEETVGKFAESLKSLIVRVPTLPLAKAEAPQTVGGSNDRQKVEASAAPSVTGDVDLSLAKKLEHVGAGEAKPSAAVLETNILGSETSGSLNEFKRVERGEDVGMHSPTAVQGEGKRLASERVKSEPAQRLKPKETAGLKVSGEAAKADGSPTMVQESAVASAEECTSASVTNVAQPLGVENAKQGRTDIVAVSGVGKKPVAGLNRPLEAGQIGDAGTLERVAKPVLERAGAVAGTNDLNGVEKVSTERDTSSSASFGEITASIGKHEGEPASAGLMTHGGNGIGSTDATSKAAEVIHGPESFDKAPSVGRELQVMAFAEGDNTRGDAGASSLRRDVQGFTHVTPGALEVGVSNGTHGWLKIRAELQDGALIASVASGTVAGREMLHRELPAMTAYLRDERLHVSALVLKDGGMELLRDSNGGSGTARQPTSNGDGQRDKRLAEMTGDGAVEDGLPLMSSNRWNGWKGMEFLPAMSGESGGWLNVRV
jgi:hypothetical protein